ncbi:MAG: MATE family efflux transporter [Clostridia bacterium]|nr:MATE family efflux transporter [Clostridia bacterium]
MQKETNKLATKPIASLLWSLGLSMILSMVLQAVYNIVDTAFVINMGESGFNGNLALTYAFPIQLLIIAIGVGTGVGINAVLSRSLGEGNRKKASDTVGNGIFLGVCIYAVFLLFGSFGARGFISFQANGDAEVIEMGTQYLSICCCSFGGIGFTIFERFLQATGKTAYSAISQIAGAAANVILDYVFIYPCKMGVAGAAWATVIGQILSLLVAMAFHYFTNREIKNTVASMKPNGKLIGEIYAIGWSAAIMQGLLSVMMLGTNLILGTDENAPLLQGSFGIYYKIMQFSLFALFGVSNTVITVLSFNYGMRDRRRSEDCVKQGMVMSLTVALFITIVFEFFAEPLAALFALAGGEANENVMQSVVYAIRIGAIGYAFMGLSVGAQGGFQALRHSVQPLVLAFLRLVAFVFPLVYLFTLTNRPELYVWISFPVAEFLTAAVALVMLKRTCRKDILSMKETVN